MTDDPSLNWVQATSFGIQMNEAEDAWNSGHVNDILALPDGAGILAAAETGGVWFIDNNNDALQLSDNWDLPDVKCLAFGPDGIRHVFAGCTVAYHSQKVQSYKPDSASAPVIMETDPGQAIPLLAWNPIANALPETAGRITRIVVIRNLRRIVVACAKIRSDDTGGIFWAQIPENRFSPGDPPRKPYVWQEAKIKASIDEGFWDLAVAAKSNDHDRENLEDRRTLTLVAGGYHAGGLVAGQWDDTDTLVFTRASVTFDDGTDATGLLFDSCGTTSVSSCEIKPKTVYAAVAWPDGRLNSLLRSADGGFSWTFCEAKSVEALGPFGLIQPEAGEQGAFWNNCISAHPENPGLVVFGWQAGTFLTLDGGATWRHIEDDTHLHADVHSLTFFKETPDSIGNLLVGSDGGVAQVNLDDYLGLAGQPFRSNFNRNLPTLQVYSTLIRQFYGTMDASRESPGMIAAGLQDNGNVSSCLTPIPGPWLPVEGGDGGWNAFIATGNGYVHNIKGELVNASDPQVASAAPVAIPVTIPAPGDPAGLRPMIGEAVIQPGYRTPEPNANLLVAIASPSESTEVYGLFTDANDLPPYHWELIGDLPAGQFVSALGSYDGAKVFAGTKKGKMYVIDVATRTASEQKVVLPAPSPSSQMAGGVFLRIVGFSAEHMFATLLGAKEKIDPDIFMPWTPAYQTYVMRLDGDTWNITPGTGLPNAYLYGFVAVGLHNSAIEQGLLASTDDAVYLTRDDGQTWRRAAAGLPRRAHCGDLRFVIDRSDSANLYLGTFGRSVWVARLNG